mmetsp:Transcript_1978/g.7624  ORF Transcript_1978/g.7624 Transcript_1978/m.7624 type:complete len:92 (-) Transcript_1978:1657-1932(-)
MWNTALASRRFYYYSYVHMPLIESETDTTVTAIYKERAAPENKNRGKDAAWRHVHMSIGPSQGAFLLLDRRRLRRQGVLLVRTPQPSRRRP